MLTAYLLFFLLYSPMPKPCDLKTTDDAFNRSVSHNAGLLTYPTHLWSVLAFADSPTRADFYGWSKPPPLFRRGLAIHSYAVT